METYLLALVEEETASLHLATRRVISSKSNFTPPTPFTQLLETFLIKPNNCFSKNFIRIKAKCSFWNL